MITNAPTQRSYIRLCLRDSLLFANQAQTLVGNPNKEQRSPSGASYFHINARARASLNIILEAKTIKDLHIMNVELISARWLK